MRFKNYLNEQENDLQKVFSLIEKECKPFLKDLKKVDDFLYSGRKIHDKWFKRKVRKDRKPKDTPIDIHKIVDDLFYEKFGVKARSNTLFCTGNSEEAEYYGNVYIIFPISKYEIFWSPKISDLWGKMQQTLDFWELYKEGDYSLIEDWMQTYQKGNLKKAIESENEIMLICDSYYAIHFNKFFYDVRDWLDAIGINLK